jgi:hypothetical protein
MRDRSRSLVIRLDDTELAKIHALAGAGDEPISFMVRRWLAERYTARLGDCPPPVARTKFGDVIEPGKGTR